MIEGEAELVVGGPSPTARTMTASAARRSGRRAPTVADLPDLLPAAAHKRRAVRIHPLRSRSWDHSTLSG